MTPHSSLEHDFALKGIATTSPRGAARRPARYGILVEDCRMGLKSIWRIAPSLASYPPHRALSL
jgi:hypothetical protein